MAIIQTHFFNISFEHKDLMKMLIKMTEYQEEMFPQDSKKIANNVKGVSIMDEVNPYNEPLDNMYHILSRLNLETVVQDNEYKEINLFTTNKLIENVNDKIDHIVEIKDGIIKEKEENEEAIILLKNLEKSKISVDEVQNTKYITCRFGKIPVEEFRKIQYYRDYEFVFRELNRSEQYVWIVYAGLTNSISEIDNAFSSMAFEHINIPEFAHGKIHEAIDELTNEAKAMNEYIGHMDDELENVKKEYKDELLELFTRLYTLKRLYDKCRYVVDFSQKASVYAFSSFDISEVEKRFGDIETVKIMELPVNIYENRNIVAPVLIKNNSLISPFEGVLSVTLGDTFDPSTLVAIVTMFLSAICIGDFGVGALLAVIGLLLTLKKSNNFGKILEIIGLAIAVGGLLYGRAFYQISLYQPLIKSPFDVIHALMLGVCIWVVIMLILVIAKKLTRKPIKI